MLGEGAREVVMTEGERLIQQGEALGIAKGRAEGRAASPFAVLSARGLEVSEVARGRIESCSDVSTLDRWLARAVTAQSVDDVFLKS